MDLKCIFSNLTIKENSEVYAMLIVSNGKETRPITLPFNAVLKNDGKVEIKDIQTLKYIEEMHLLGEFDKSFTEMTLFKPYDINSQEKITVKSINPYETTRTRKIVNEKLEINICVLDKKFYDNLNSNLKNTNFENTNLTYEQNQESMFHNFFESADTIKKILKYKKVDRNILSNYEKFYDTFPSNLDTSKEIARKYIDETKNKNEFEKLYVKFMMTFLRKMTPIREIFETTTTIELDADIHNYTINRFIDNDFNKTKEEVINFGIFAYSFYIMGKSNETNKYIVDYNENIIENMFLKTFKELI